MVLLVHLLLQLLHALRQALLHLLLWQRVCIRLSGMGHEGSAVPVCVCVCCIHLYFCVCLCVCVCVYVCVN